MFFAGAAFAAETKNIQIITWRGITQAEQGFFSKLEQLGVQANYDHFDAFRHQIFDLKSIFLSEKSENKKSFR